MKDVVGAIAVILTLVNYVPYIRDVIRGKTHPHIYSWFLWGIITTIVFALQVSDHAGPGAFVTLSAGLLSFLIFFLGLRIGQKDITRMDSILLIMTLVAVAIWLFAKQPVISIILITLADLLAFGPTIRKSWHKPHTETLSLYASNTFKFFLTLFALQHYTTITLLNPLAWLLANSFFAIMLILRRRTLATA